jgi:hypothetical protein
MIIIALKMNTVHKWKQKFENQFHWNLQVIFFSLRFSEIWCSVLLTSKSINKISVMGTLTSFKVFLWLVLKSIDHQTNRKEGFTVSFIYCSIW